VLARKLPSELSTNKHVAEFDARRVDKCCGAARGLVSNKRTTDAASVATSHAFPKGMGAPVVGEKMTSLGKAEEGARGL